MCLLLSISYVGSGRSTGVVMVENLAQARSRGNEWVARCQLDGWVIENVSHEIMMKLSFSLSYDVGAGR